MIPGKIFTSFAEFQGIVSVNDFRLPLGFQEGTFASFSGFLVKFCFCTDTPGSIEWLDPVPRLHIDDCFETRNCRLGPCDLLLSSHKICGSRYGFAIASSAWGPFNFGPFTDLAISVFREMSINTVFTQILTSLCSRHWRESSL